MKTFLFSLLLSFSLLAMGEEASIRIENLQMPEMPPGAKTAAIYLDIINQGAADRLLSAEATETAHYAELHATSLEGDVMRMRKIEALDLPSGATISLKPGGLHLMLIDLKHALQAGQSFPLILRFEKAGTQQLMVPVRGREGRMKTVPHESHH